MSNFIFNWITQIEELQLRKDAFDKKNMIQKIFASDKLEHTKYNLLINDMFNEAFFQEVKLLTDLTLINKVINNFMKMREQINFDRRIKSIDSFLELKLPLSLENLLIELKSITERKKEQNQKMLQLMNQLNNR